MKTYILDEGERYTVANEAALVHAMHEASFTKAEDDAAFMQDMAKRVKEMTGTELDTSTPEAFVAGLVKVGLAKEEE